MKPLELIKLICFALYQGLCVLLARAGDVFNVGLPWRAEKVVQPEMLSTFIADYSNPAGSNDISLPLTELRVRAVKSTSSNCENLVFDAYSAAADEKHGSELHSAEQQSFFLKLPMQPLVTHWFFALIGSWELECYFCRHIAPRIPFRTPRTYAVHAQGTRFFLLQENLLDDPSVQLFTNMDMQQGVALPLAYQCMDTFAQLHASHFGLSEPEREAILPLKLHPFLGPQTGRVSRAMNTFALEPCLKKVPGRIPAPIVDAYRKSLDNWDALLEHWFSGPLSLLHGDSHLGNFFVSGDAMGMLDFQAVHWGKGTRDVQYFLSDSLPAEVLAKNERELIEYYVSRRAHHGAAIDFDQCWDEYRSFSYHALMTIVVSIGFGALNEEQDTLMLELLDRAVASAQRLDYPGWLDGFLQQQQRSGSGA